MKGLLLSFLQALADSQWVAQWLYLIAWITIGILVARAQSQRKIDLWDAIRTTDKQGNIRIDPRKTFEAGVFLAMLLGFIYMVFQGVIATTEGLAYTTIFVGAFVTARALRDREQRLNRALDLQQQNGGTNGKP